MKDFNSIISQSDLEVRVHPDVLRNLNPKFELRPYQKEALARFGFYVSEVSSKNHPTQLLFHMATGSGKTLVMAACILELYRKGYRRFLFFVNSTAIIEKTRDNFLNPSSSKYLFHSEIRCDGKRFEVLEVENFEGGNEEGLQIVFTTVQGLHTNLNSPKENSLTFEDFDGERVVLISDEAHHLNADTKKGNLSKKESADFLSWETTVNQIFNSHPENYLLEFTATADLENPFVREKYADKLIFDYSLKAFREDKYSKEIQLLQSDSEPFERALQAVILSQYRKKIFQDFKLNIKPVLLLKSRTIHESLSFYDEFLTRMMNLSESDFFQILERVQSSVFRKILDYFTEKNISLENFLLEIKEDFNEEKCLVINSKTDSEEKQLLVNNLEEKSNEYRVVFAVDKLNEGWDVLNLFDIVRLYTTVENEHRAGKIGRTTMSEAQLIGRGARYCPFGIDENSSVYQRKFDENPDHPLRICEELYYHAAHNPAYISELTQALVKIGLKSEVSESSNPKFISKGKSESSIKRSQKLVFEEGLPIEIRNFIYKVEFSTGQFSVLQALENSLLDKVEKDSKVHVLGAFGEAVLRKALHRSSFYRFDQLRGHFPALKSIAEFIHSDKYLKNIQIELMGDAETVVFPSKEIQLKATLLFLDELRGWLETGKSMQSLQKS